MVLSVQRASDDCITFGGVKCSALCMLRTLGCSSCSQQLNNPTLLIRSCVLAGSASLSDSLPANDGTRAGLEQEMLVHHLLADISCQSYQSICTLVCWIYSWWEQISWGCASLDRGSFILTLCLHTHLCLCTSSINYLTNCQMFKTNQFI